MSSALLSADNISISVGSRLLVDQLSFHIRPGKTTALVGESGSGKSISAMSLVKLLPDSMSMTGSVKFKGENLWQLSEAQLRHHRRTSISYIFQEPMTALNPLHIIDRQIRESIPDTNSNEKTRARVGELLQQVNLPDNQEFRQAYPHQLSGGQRQRVMIAMALAKKPEVLIADEPTTALDVTVQKEILDLIRQLQHDLGLAVLLITHDIHLVKAYSDEVCVLKDGKLIESQSTLDLFRKPKSDYTQSLIDDQTFTSPSQCKSEPILKLSNVDSFYTRPRTGFVKPPDFHVLKNIELTLYQGEILGIIGESGSGKTTLANVLLKLHAASGKYDFAGHDIISINQKAMKPIRPMIQAVFQDPFSSLSPRMTVHDIVAEGLKADIHRIKNYSKSDIRHQVSASLSQVGLSDEIMNRYPHEFSGGQRQRIAIARAIILKPRCIILDEPTSALDRNVQQQVLELIISLQKKLNIAFILITHDLQLVQALAHRVIIMNNGEIVEQGKTADIYQHPKQAYTQRLLAAYPANLSVKHSLDASS